MENVGHSLLVLLFGEQLDRAVIWTAIIAVVTVIGVVVARRQLVGIRATSRADFTFRFIESFFTSETRVLFLLLMNSALAFDTKDIVENGKTHRLPYLKINLDIVAQIKGIVTVIPDKTGYSSYEVDDLLIGHFESLGWYVRKRLIDFDAAYSTFSDYLMRSYEHSEIQNFLVGEDNKDFYRDFAYLYKRFRNHKLRLRTARP
jgi:hypothetical protein